MGSLDFFLLAFLAQSPAQAPLDIQSALAELASSRAAERNAAERWLSQNLRAADLPLVARAAHGASLEVRRRLEAALGADERHFALAALLLAEAEPEIAELGEAALRRHAATWSGAATLTPVPGNLALRILDGRVQQRWSLQPDEGGLAWALERVVLRAGREAREGGPVLAIVLDPALDELAPGRPAGSSAVPRAEGVYPELLVAVLAAHGARAEGFGLDGPSPWVRVAAPPDLGLARGEDLLVRWVRAVLAAGGRPAGASAARALGSAGWPAALTWLESLWFERKDTNGLEGALAAAARGAVVPSLARAERVRALLDYADKRLAEGDAGAQREVRGIQGALAALRPIGSDGSDLAATVAQGLGAASHGGRKLRLSILADMARLPVPTRKQLREELAGPAPELDALRALASTPLEAPEPLTIARPRLLLEAAAEAGILPLAVTWLASLGAQPSAAWHQPANLPTEWPSELCAAVFAWWQSIRAPGAAEAALEHLLSLCQSVPEADEAALGRALAALVRGGGGAPLRKTMQSALQRAGTGRAGDVLRRLEAHAGLLDAEGEWRLLAQLERVESPSAATYAAMAVLARGPAAPRARALLLAWVQHDLERGAAEKPAWEEPMGEVLRSLDLSGQDLELRTLRRELRTALTRAKHPLAGRLDRAPAPRAPGALPMEAFELEFPEPTAAGR